MCGTQRTAIRFNPFAGPGAPRASLAGRTGGGDVSLFVRSATPQMRQRETRPGRTAVRPDRPRRLRQPDRLLGDHLPGAEDQLTLTDAQHVPDHGSTGPAVGMKEGGSPARFARAVELGPDLVCVGVMQVLEDGQGLL